MRGILLCFSIGVVVAHQFSHLPPPWLLPVMLVILAPTLIWSRLRPPWAFLAGLWLAVHTAQGILDERLPDLRAGETRDVEGRITTLPVITDNGSRFVFRPHGPTAVDLPPQLLVRWFGSPQQLEAGSEWRLKLRLQPPQHRLNPGGFDLERYYLLNRIGAIASVVQDETNRQLAPGGGLPLLRQHLSHLVRTGIADPGAAALGVALSVGDRQYIDSGLRERLHTTGTAHLVAISGLHIGLVAGGVWWMASLLWRLKGQIAVRVPAVLAGIVPALIAAAIYSALAGFALPTRRALLMVALLCLAMLLRRRTSPWTVLLLALACVLVLDPLAPLGAGLWLSFGAVAVLLWILRGHPPTASHIIQYLRLQMVLLIALAPVTLLWFGHIAWLAPIANLIAIPLVGSLAVPVLLTGLSIATINEAAGGFLLAWAGWMLQVLDRVLALVADLGPGGTLGVNPPALPILISVAGAVLLLLPRGVPGKLCGSGLLLLPLLWQPPALPVERADVTLMDAGHGHALLVRTREHALLFDTGSTYISRDLDVLLRKRGVGSLDLLLLSNPRAGSIGGADSLKFPVTDKIGVGQARDCSDIPRWTWDGVLFRFLDTESGAIGDCLLLIEAGGDRLLVAHAMTPRTRFLLDDTLIDEKINWLVAPRHGHRSGVTKGLANLLSPDVVFVPINNHNRYGLPHPETVEIWEGSGAELLQTGETGAVTLHLGRREYITERGQGRYWQQ